MSELLSCPFCGGEAELGHRGVASVVFCKNCHAKTNEYPISTKHSSDDEAVEAWNRRQGEQKKMDKKKLEVSLDDLLNALAKKMATGEELSRIIKLDPTLMLLLPTVMVDVWSKIESRGSADDSEE